jgi:nitroreductase
MKQGGEVRRADFPIDKLFLDRWSPRAMSGEKLTRAQLMTVLEAARWAPSSYNNQPWRIVYALRETEHWPQLFNLLVEVNQLWARNAGALLLFLSKTTFDFNGKESVTHSYDCGAAWENLALQCTLLGLVCHGMQGFDYERAKKELAIPDGYRVEAMAAIGLPGNPEELPEKLRERESPNDRKRLSEMAFEGRSGLAGAM